MKNTSKYKFPPVKPHLMIALLAIALLAWGCDDSTVVGDNSNNSSDDKPVVDLTPGETDEHGHGPDDDTVLIPPGFVNGSWRASAIEDDSLVATLDLIQEEGAEEVEGYFTMSSLAGNGADSKSGDILESSSFDGDTLIINWNPTAVEDELYTIEATRVDEDTFTGTVSAKFYDDFDKDIHITRSVAPPSTDGDGDDADLDFDAGPQGGAGGD